MTEATCPHLDDLPSGNRPGPKGTRTVDSPGRPPAAPAEDGVCVWPPEETYDGSLALLASWG